MTKTWHVIYLIVITILICIITFLTRIKKRQPGVVNVDNLLIEQAKRETAYALRVDSLNVKLAAKDSIIQFYEKNKKALKRNEVHHNSTIDRMDAGQLIEYSAGTSVGEPDYIIQGPDSVTREKVRLPGR
jgi:hypothetical protein